MINIVKEPSFGNNTFQYHWLKTLIIILRKSKTVKKV